MTRVLLAILEFYRRWLSPAVHSLGPGGCRYLPTCSEYASVAIATHGPLRGTMLAVWRVLRCHPLSRGGLDPVPSPRSKDRSPGTPEPVVLAPRHAPHEPLP
jgi:putative membrane protein insertion efficiency factor